VVPGGVQAHPPYIAAGDCYQVNLPFPLRGGSLVTPPLASGLLPGILREELLETGQCSEAVLRLSDLRDARVRVGNSLRGLLAAEWAAGGS
jgi:branched-subunit amino acid aminotransferase/4-amino-4-deoxychorismate lyase